MLKVASGEPKYFLSSSHRPDTGCGNPSQSTAEKGQRYVEAVGREVADVLVELSNAEKGELPYL